MKGPRLGLEERMMMVNANVGYMEEIFLNRLVGLATPVKEKRPHTHSELFRYLLDHLKSE